MGNDFTVDPRCKPGAYIALGTCLYEVIFLQSIYNAGLGERWLSTLRVLDAKTEEPGWLAAAAIHEAVLVQPAPVLASYPPL